MSHKKKKGKVTVINNDGSVTQEEIYLPDDQYISEISQEEININFQNNQPIIKKDFIEILKKTFNEIDKVNERIKNLENIITEHNTLLKNIIKQISK
jgi:predicted DNA-binding ArsR family transcriptional regulator